MRKPYIGKNLTWNKVPLSSKELAHMGHSPNYGVKVCGFRVWCFRTLGPIFVGHLARPTRVGRVMFVAFSWPLNLIVSNTRYAQRGGTIILL